MRWKSALWALALCLALSACQKASPPADTAEPVPLTLTITSREPAATTGAPEETDAKSPTKPLYQIVYSPPGQFSLPLSESSIREEFAALFPDCVLQEIAERAEGYFLLFSPLKTAPGSSCALGVYFLVKQTGALAPIAGDWPYGVPYNYMPLINGYTLVNDTTLYLYRHWYEVSNDHRLFPFVDAFVYEDGVLFRKPGPGLFYPLASNEFYSGFDIYPPDFVTLTAAFATRGGLAVLLDPTDMSYDMLVSPRVRFAYDAETHRMTLSLKSVRIDVGQTGDVHVSADDPYIESARVERYDEGVRIVLRLKPAAEVYTFRHYSFERAVRAAPEQSQIVGIEFASREAAEKASGYYILDEITYICTEEETK